MYTNDATKPSSSTLNEKTGKERVSATQPWDNQREEEGKEGRVRINQRADHHADSTYAVRPFTFPHFVILIDFIRISPRTQEFIAQQMQIMAAMQAEQEQRAREAEERKARRLTSARNRASSQVPPLPPLPPQNA